MRKKILNLVFGCSSLIALSLTACSPQKEGQNQSGSSKTQASTPEEAKNLINEKLESLKNKEQKEEIQKQLSESGDDITKLNKVLENVNLQLNLNNEINNLQFQYSVKGNEVREGSLANIYADGIDSPNDVFVQVKGKDEENKYLTIIKEVKPNKAKGEVEIKFDVVRRGHETVKTSEKHIIKGFRTGDDPQRIFDQGINKSISNPNVIKAYIAKSQAERFASDNEDYIKALSRQLATKPGEDVSVESLRKRAGDSKLRKEITDDQYKNSKDKFDSLVKEKQANLDSFDNWLLKTFSVPLYDKDGKFQGFSINEGSQFGIGPSWIDSAQRNKFQINGYPRTILNEQYLRQALQTWHIEFANPARNEYIDENTRKREIIPNTFTPTAGTAWIMDYALDSTGTYPTKWYVGTNLHVAQALTNETNSFSIARLQKDTTQITNPNQLASTGYDFRIEKFNFLLGKTKKEEWPIKIVYTATDYLSKDPKDYLDASHQDFLKDKQEFADFAILEIDFSKIKSGNDDAGNYYFSTYGNPGAPEQFAANLRKIEDDLRKANGNESSLKIAQSNIAKFITNDYANLKGEHDKVEFIAQDYLHNYEKIDRPLDSEKKYDGDSLYAVGWPRADLDYKWDQYADEKEIKNKKLNYELWINKDGQVSIKNNKDGNWLSYVLGYRTINDKPGIVDAFISAPKNGAKFHEYDGKQWVSVGLNYSPKHYAPFGGSSGTSIRNQNNQLVAVFHSANQNAGAGLAVAFRSQGYDYKGIFKGDSKNYELPQYDLIYGGGKDQKEGASYREAMKKLYESQNIKTYLFPNGFADDKVPEKFKFSK